VHKPLQKTLALLCLVMLIAAFAVAASAADSKAKASKEPVPLAEIIAHAGHGKLFDQHMKEIKSDTALMAIQDAILEAVLKDPSVAKDEKALKAVSKAMKAAKDAKPDDRLILHNAVVLRLLRDARQDLRRRYDWRNNVLINYYITKHPAYLKVISGKLLQIISELGRLQAYFETNYMADCRAAGVPIPPNWAQTGTEWVQQGTLSDNLLAPGGFAAVWTWSDPHNRGACIALPRDSGAPGTLAGIICQSATTGNACFWDNKLRSNPTQALGWDGITLVIADLVDGSNLSENCTSCHKGNNVYLIAPSDPTWTKLLQGPMDGVRTGTFTTQVESSTDNTGGHPRYIPVTTSPPRAGWVNAFTAGCGGSCHEGATHIRRPADMPPLCALGPTGVAGCYGTP
jgi:hypothetical protein